jgi:hypothetical protein
VHIANGLLRCARNDERGQRSTDVTPAPEPGFGFCDWVVAKAAGPRVKPGGDGVIAILENETKTLAPALTEC